MLTDEEIGAISCMNLGVYDYARTIERAVLEKAMPIPKQEPVGKVRKVANGGPHAFQMYDNLPIGESEVYLSAQQSAQAAAIPEGWQPIEAAPLDGTDVDLWIVARGCEFRAPNFKYSGTAWIGSTSDEPLDWHYGNSEMKATHFMVRPAPPKENT